MGCCCVRKMMALFVLSGVILAAFVGYLKMPGDPIVMNDLQYWGPKPVSKSGDVPKDDEKIYNLKINFDEKMIEDLKAKLGETKFVEPLEDSAYHYGVNGKTFKNVIDYWRNKYDFNKQLAKINAFPHYQTQIEGLKIHFFRSRPANVAANIKVIPILMIHGWPGSFVEFLKAAPMMSKAENGYAFDVIVPSLPGYGFSEASRKQGMDSFVTARIFTKLMKRLGYEQYYVQGGDWGSMVTTLMSAMYPQSIRGIHLNMAFPDNKGLTFIRDVLAAIFPKYFTDGEIPPCWIRCLNKRFSDLLRETGYMHIQSTKPDTIGMVLLNHPASLAAYLLEKFSTWTVSKNRFLEDGGLGQKLSLDDILTNVMIYYTTNSIATSQRYYKENMYSPNLFKMYSNPITTPTGFAIFPNEITCVPRFVMEEKFHNITHYTYPKDGGHFAAFEQPQLLTADVRVFVEGIEKTYPTTYKPVKDIVAAA